HEHFKQNAKHPNIRTISTIASKMWNAVRGSRVKMQAVIAHNETKISNKNIKHEDHEENAKHPNIRTKSTIASKNVERPQKCETAGNGPIPQPYKCRKRYGQQLELDSQ
ncbi:9428_t:CDS:2, partial [Gigaspora margarita]